MFVHPSLTALVKLAQACPALEALMMHIADVDQNELESLEEYAKAEDGQQTALLEIHPECDQSMRSKQPHLSDVDRLAAVLHHLFPKLRGVEPSSADDSWTHSLKYRDVCGLLEKLYVLNVDATAT